MRKVCLMSDYLGQPRFRVSELHGYSKGGYRHGQGRTLTIIDRAYCGQVVRMWRSEELASNQHVDKEYGRFVQRIAADALCAELNAK